jgi:fatty acid desaturase
METLTAIPNRQVSNYVPDHHDLVVSPAEEKAIARELTPSIAWPTLVLAIALPSILAALVYLGFSRVLPLWLCTPILALVSYSHYTLVHESIHGNLVPGYPRWRWLNEIVGWVGSLGMGLAWPFLKRTHVKHHSHTNTKLDPDIFVKGTLAQLFVKWAIMSVMSFIPLPLLKHVNRDRYERVSHLLIGTESWQMAAVTCLTPALLVAAFVTGHLAEWFFLWFLPIRFAALLLNVFFQWLPHHPFDRTERYLNTRISLWAGGTIFTLQQNLHLMHHLWPSVPFYRYYRLYRRLRPVLLEKGSRIEGLMTGSRAQDKRPLAQV